MMPQTGRNARAEYEAAHIPGARFFDIDAVSDPASDPTGRAGLPHMLPSPERFAEEAGALGVSAGDTVVAYDTHGLMSAARSEEHTSELQSLMRISYAVFCLKKKNTHTPHHEHNTPLHRQTIKQ